VEATDAIGTIVNHVRRLRPHIVVTYNPFGAYDHPDHIAVCRFTLVAVVAAADRNYEPSNGHLPHRVAKLYYMANRKELRQAAQNAF
jgi:N-acetyl-1-D-myo-inositol-2-amino-2-deoxy-alpha-D-glucopyranoside deacetylase